MSRDTKNELDLQTWLERKIMFAVGTVQHIRKLRTTNANTYQKLKALHLEKHLKQTVLDLADWQRRFDPSWYLITRVANPQVDKRKICTVIQLARDYGRRSCTLCSMIFTVLECAYWNWHCGNHSYNMMTMLQFRRKNWIYRKPCRIRIDAELHLP